MQQRSLDEQLLVRDAIRELSDALRRWRQLAGAAAETAAIHALDLVDIIDDLAWRANIDANHLEQLLEANREMTAVQ